MKPVRVDISVQSLLDIGTIEIYLCSGRRVVSCVDDTELTVKVGTCVRDVIDVEAGIDLKDSGVEVVELIASPSLGAVRIGEYREWALRRRELEVRVQVKGVVTSSLPLPSCLQESIVEIEELFPVFDVGEYDDLLLNRFIADDRVVDRSTR